ncbi:hypothetical protein PMAYCL1PPCAC_28276 [Pristionchus mayeri]|uniref:G protein-coupled receptor n=1 Tax=Pristionchus mayeri TaxID=1317129 RepID=A0AAN5ICY9_9BILA|nr:hypothetical protein PMAYCL1PPCAC_28276 [Pristionchus mayeri]
MVTWGEVAPDIVLSILYIYILIRLFTASDAYFKTPFYIFFSATGVYSITTVISYQLILNVPLTEQFWTFHFNKIFKALNVIGAAGATFGKAAIAIHRYFVLRHRDFSEKRLSSSTILRVLVVQFVIALLETAAIWPASYVYATKNGFEYIADLSRVHAQIEKAFSIANYVLYVICNLIFSILASRELFQTKGMLQDKSATSRKILIQQRNLFIIVSVCSLSHLLKAVQQCVHDFRNL